MIATPIEIKILIEKKIDILLKERKLYFSEKEYEPIHSSGWRKMNSYIALNTRRIADLRREWRYENAKKRQ